jgi:hypothetical protein
MLQEVVCKLEDEESQLSGGSGLLAGRLISTLESACEAYIRDSSQQSGTRQI